MTNQMFNKFIKYFFVWWRIMKFNRTYFIYPVGIILFILLLFLPNIVDLIPSEEMRFVSYIILVLLVFIFIVFETYQDIKKKQFTTDIYVILVDIIAIISFVSVIYISFKSYNLTNIEILLQNKINKTMASIFFFCAILLQSYLKSQKFKK